jgi:tetratricopeptide (TPR) repeat protein
VHSARRAEVLETAAEWRTNDALREAEIGNAARARQSATEALALSTGPDVELQAALALARAGETTRAQKLVDKLNREFPLDTLMQDYWLPSVQAAIELEKNDPAKAIDLLNTAIPYELGSTSKSVAFYGHLYPVYIGGLARLRAGQGQQAVAEFQKVLDHRGIVGNFILGALAHLQLGRAQAMMGDKAAARKSYEDFLTLWKDADPDVPILRAAKAEYAKLN